MNKTEQKIAENQSGVKDFLDVHASEIPLFLKGISQWAVWKSEQDKDGKWKKVPKTTDGKNIKWQSEKNLYDFQAVYDAYSTGKFDGINFVPMKGQGLVAYDFDDCIDDSGKIDTEIENILKVLNSYTERSPSGKGLRVFVVGKIPDEFKKVYHVGNIEYYSEGKVLTVTGQRLTEYPADVELRGAEVAQVCNMLPKSKAENDTSEDFEGGTNTEFSKEEIEKILKKARKNTKFNDLYEGNIPEQFEGDQSRADQSLCSSLAYWFDCNPEVMDKVFIESKLYRDKWNERHGEQTYGERTIQKAIEFFRKNGKDTAYVKNKKRAEAVKEASESGGYGVIDGELCFVDKKKVDENSNPIPLPLCNFDARIREEIKKDDSIDITIVYRISGKAKSGIPLPEIDVLSSQFSSLQWISRWGAQANIHAGQNKKDHLRAAIQTLSIANGIPARMIYTHFGWRKINGKWFYLSCSGAIGADGLHNIEVVPEGKEFEKYALPAPDGDLKEAVKASLRILDIADRRISVPVLASAFRAALNELSDVDYSVFLSGHTGVRKTELAAIMQAHFGNFHSRNLPCGWNVTANALEKSAFLTKDSIMVIDDFVPQGSPKQVNDLNSKADKVLRGAANHTPRRRMKPDGSFQTEYNPRCLVVTTGEDIPKGQSLRGRMMILEIEKDTVNLEILTECQSSERKGLFALSMAGFVKWLASQNFDRMRELIADKKIQLRDEAIPHLSNQHSRTPEIVSSLMIGFEAFLNYAASVGALSEDEAVRHRKEAWESLLSIGKKQSDHQTSEDPVNRFIDILSSAISSGQAHIAGTDNGTPENFGSLGWRGDKGKAEFAQPQGDRIGWIDKDGIYLDRDAAYSVVQQIATRQHNHISVSQTTLWKGLKAKGLLASFVREKTITRKTIAGSRKDVLHIRGEVLKLTGTIGTKGTIDNNNTVFTDGYECSGYENSGNEKGTIGTITPSPVSVSESGESECSGSVFRFSDEKTATGTKSLNTTTENDTEKDMDSPIVPFVPAKNDKRGLSEKNCFSCKGYLPKKQKCEFLKWYNDLMPIPNPEADHSGCKKYQALEN